MTPIVDSSKFVSSVKNNLSGVVVGYAGIIGGAGIAPQPFNDGQARTSANAPAAAFTLDTPLALGSVSKFLTALAAMKLLDSGNEGANSLGADLNTPIWMGGLPKDWVIRDDAREITYRDLLAHTSGLPPEGADNDPGQDYFALKKLMTTTSIRLLSRGVSRYSNDGFALFRLLIPKLAGLVSDDLSVPEENRAGGYAAAYSRYIRENVFGAVGVRGPDTLTPPGSHAFMYYYPGDKPGNDISQATYPGQTFPGQGQPLVAGAQSWWASVHQLRPVLDSINADDGRILSSGMWSDQQGIDATGYFSATDWVLTRSSIRTTPRPGG